MPIKSLARGRNFTAGDTSRTVSQRWRAALLDDRLRLTTRGQTVVPGAAKTSNDLDPFATSHDRAPKPPWDSGTGQPPQRGVGCCPVPCPGQWSGQVRDIDCPKGAVPASRDPHPLAPLPTRLAASKWFEARQNALRSAAAFLTGSGSPSLMQPASQ